MGYILDGVLGNNSYRAIATNHAGGDVRLGRLDGAAALRRCLQWGAAANALLGATGWCSGGSGEREAGPATCGGCPEPTSWRQCDAAGLLQLGLRLTCCSASACRRQLTPEPQRRTVPHMDASQAAAVEPGWATPDFEEIRMDAEIGSYQDDFDVDEWH